MTKKLSQHGNSLALVFDRPILDLLKIGPTTELEITTDGEVLVVAPVRDKKRENKFKEAVAWANKRYAKDLKQLAG